MNQAQVLLSVLNSDFWPLLGSPSLLSIHWGYEKAAVSTELLMWILGTLSSVLMFAWTFLYQ